MDLSMEWESASDGILMDIANASRNSIQTWALEEARRRLEAEGILEEKE